LSIDLNAIDAMPIKTDAYGQKYIYDLPTLDDPNPARAHNSNGSNVNDPFGGDDGLIRQSWFRQSGTDLFAGYRNPFDIVLTRAES